MLAMIKRMRFGGRQHNQVESNASEDVCRRLRELRLLFDEYDHRVKNNTQMMLSVLAAAGRGAMNPEARFALDAVASKLKAIVHIQSILQRAGHVETLRCDDLLRELSRTIQAASPYNFALIVDSDPVELPSSAALPLGLILNELLTNAIKHGIDARHGCVRVSLKMTGEAVELRVEDNGPGMQGCEATRRSTGLGLVEHLASQLHGQFQMHPGPGGRGVLRFSRVDLAIQ
jgi:two-component sensor histidine kinase